MIISRIIGGLGNQMFQYACGLSLARHHNVPLFLDIREFEQYPLRKFTLDKFTISASTKSGDHLPEQQQIHSPLVRLLPKFYKPRGIRIVRERSMLFDETIWQQGNNVYLDGYWQSEKYFTDVTDMIRKEFSVRQQLDETNQQMLEKIRTEQSVSLHVRRGDYVNHPLYATCTLQYYHQALAKIQTQHPDCTVYVFSDDPEWVKSNIKTNAATTYITNNQGDNDYKDMLLMSGCRHHIIANSSFSWWGAWLGTSADAIVIAPNAWYTDATKNTRDLLPSSWITIPV